MSQYSDEMTELDRCLDEQLRKRPFSQEQVERLTITLIAHIARELNPEIRYVALDWSDQGGNHHVMNVFVGGDGKTFLDDDPGYLSVGGNSIEELCRNLSGEARDLYADYNSVGGSGRIDVRAVLA